MILAGSGHRLSGLYHGKLKRELRHLARDQIARLEGHAVISGMALGWDQAVALAAIDLTIPFTAVVPFTGMERKWSPDMQAEFHWIIERAERVVTISEGFSLERYQERNVWMVDHAEAVMALWDGRKHGGTFNCLQYAHQRGVRVHHLWQDWQDRFEAVRAAESSRRDRLRQSVSSSLRS